jgi:hypothetical protein
MSKMRVQDALEMIQVYIFGNISGSNAQDYYAQKKAPDLHRIRTEKQTRSLLSL